MDKALGLITICRKAGMLEMGMDSVKDACKNRTAKCVIVSTEISPKSLKEVKFFCSAGNIEIFSTDATMDEMWSALGKKVGILAVCDKGFKKKLSTMLEKIKIED